MIDFVLGNRKSQVFCDEPEVLTSIAKLLSVEVDLDARKRSGFKIPKYKSYLSKKGLFNTVLFPFVSKYLEDKGISFEVEDRRISLPTPSIDSIVDSIESMPFNLRPYQIECVVKAITSRGGLITIGTGGGKGVILAAILKAWDVPVLIPMKDTGLMKQLRNEIVEYIGIDFEDVGFIGGGEFKIGKQFTIATVQSLNSLRSKDKVKKLKEMYNQVRIVVVDECHNITSPSYRKVLDRCSKAPIYYGLSATPLGEEVRVESDSPRGKKVRQDLPIVAQIGPLIFKKTCRQLIDEGWLADVTIKFIHNSIETLGEMLPYAKEYDRSIIKSEERNELIATVINQHSLQGLKVVGFVSRLEHGKAVLNVLSEKGFDSDSIGFANGQNIVDNRQEVIDGFKAGELDVLIGTVIGEGHNFKCDIGINFSAGRSEVNILQYLGRILRKVRRESGDIDPSIYEHVIFYDFSDSGHYIFNNQYRKRLSVLTREGFEIEHIDVQEVLKEIK